MKKLALGGIKRAVRFMRESHALHTLVAIVLILNMLVAASVAWFTLNRKTDVDEMGMALAVDDTMAVYKAYMFNISTGKGTALGADNKPLDVTNLDLNQYDTIFRAQNRLTRALAQITLTRHPAMPGSGTGIITIDREELSAQAGEGESLTAYSSSTIRFTGFTVPDHSDLTILNDANLTDEEKADKLYTSLCTQELFDEIELYRGNNYDNSQTFVTVEYPENGDGTTHTHNKYTSIQVFVKYDKDDWYTDANDNNAQKLNVYLYISYDVQLIECYIDEHKGGSISLNQNSFFFENDMTEIRVSYEEQKQ